MAENRYGRRVRHAASLDGLRCLCALAVVGYHMRLEWLGGGLLGVSVLFVLAGYLMCTGLAREFSRNRGTLDVLGYYVRRLWRLMPTVIVFICVTGGVCALFNHVLFTKMRPDLVPALLMFINWAKIFRNESYFAAAGAQSPLTHFWSLAIECQLWLIFPPLFYLVMRRGVKRKFVTLGLVVLALVSAGLLAALYVQGADPSRAYFGTDTRAVSVLLGAALAIIWPYDRISVRPVEKLGRAKFFLVQAAGPLALVALIVCMVLTEGYTSFSYYGGILGCSILAAIVILSLIPRNSLLSKVLSLPPLVWVGKRSFAIYVWHYPILELMNPLNATSSISWQKLLLELVLILVVSDLSLRLVEHPLRSWAMARSTLGEACAPEGEVAPRLPLPQAVLALPAWLPAAAVTGVMGAIMAFGIFTVEPVTVAGAGTGDQVVMQASLKKPLHEGVYDVVLIGDSVSLGANEELNAVFPHGLIDTRGEREMSEALEVLEGYLASGIVGDDVVISIGTNGMLDEESLERLCSDVSDSRRLWMVNLRSPNAKDQDNNRLIAELCEKHPNVSLVDWNAASEGHEDWLIEDGIHLTWDGREAFADLIVKTMGYEPPTELNTVYQVTIMGDSVCLNAADGLASSYPHGLVDTADGRSLSAACKAFRSYVDGDVVGGAVVLAVGSEEPLLESDLDAFVNAAGASRKLWFVNVRTAQAFEEANNKIISHVCDTHSNVTLIDWYEASQGHDDWFTSDGSHLTKKGVEAYVALIQESVTTEAIAVATEGMGDKDADADTDESEASEETTTSDESEYDTGEEYVDESSSESETDSESNSTSTGESSDDESGTEGTSSDGEGEYASDSSDSYTDYGYDDSGSYDESYGYDESYSYDESYDYGYDESYGYDQSYDYGYDESYDYGYDTMAA